MVQGRWLGRRAERREAAVILLLAAAVTLLTSLFHVLHVVTTEVESARHLGDALAADSASVAAAVAAKSDDPPTAARAARSEELTSLMERQIRVPGVAFVALTDPAGEVLLARPESLEEIPRLALSLDELAARSFAARASFLWRGGLLLGRAVPLEREGRTIATLVVGQDASLLAPRLHDAVRGSLLVGAAALVASLVAALGLRWLSRRAIRNLASKIDALRSTAPDASSRFHMDLSGLSEQIDLLGEEIESERLRALSQKESLEGVLDALQDGVLLLDGGEILYFNRACECLLGGELHELAGRELASVLAPGHVLLEVAAMAERELAFERRYFMCSETERFREVLVSAHTVSSTGGVVLLFEDLEPFLALQSLVEYGSRSIWITRASREILHDVGNPLQSMRLHLLQIREHLERGEDEEAVAAVEPIERAIVDLHTIVREFFEPLGRAPDEHRETVDLAEVVREVAALLELEAAQRGLQLEMHVEEGSGTDVGANRVALRHVFVNVIKNAFEASTEKGSVVRIRVAGGDDRVVVEVEDEGDGIDPSECEHVFELGVTHKPGGSGIGLATVKRVVRDYGGDVTLEPSSGGGALMRLHLPRHEAVASPAPADGLIGSGEGSP